MNLSRRGFIGGAASFLALCQGRVFAAKPGAFTGGTPSLTFGVLSDVHICLAAGGKALKKGFETGTLVKAFAWFRDNGADAVVIAGDMAHSGLVGELKAVADAWFQVFPDDKAPDGRKVERVFVFGNHDWSSPGRAKEVFPDEAERNANLLVKDPQKWWQEIFHEPWTPFYRKTVKGYDFIGAHWCNGGCNGKKEVFTKGMREFYAGQKFDPEKPFFHIQHPQPKGTAHGENVWGQDDGVSTEILSAHPNAVAFSGHSHTSLTDVRSIWQGAFTSVGCGTLRDVNPLPPLPPGTTTYVGGCENYKSPKGVPAEKFDDHKALAMIDKYNCRQGQLVRVYSDRMVFSRREFVTGVQLGPDLVMPLPVGGEKPFAFPERQAKAKPPAFPADAKLAAKKVMAKLRRKKPKTKAECWELEFPAANAQKGARPALYEISAQGADGKTCAFGLACEGFRFPLSDKRAKKPLVFRVDCSRVAAEPMFSVRAVSAWGKWSEPLKA
ncbi:MAG: metallophosphoesterase [bacterium]|nr:metallophosphoesterase [bacterium]